MCPREHNVSATGADSAANSQLLPRIRDRVRALVIPLVFRRFKVVHLSKRADPILALECGTNWRVEQRNDVRIEVRDGVYVVDRVVTRLVHVLGRLEARHEPPTAVEVALRRFAVHERDLPPLAGNHVGSDAAAVTRCYRFDLIGVNSEWLIGCARHRGNTFCTVVCTVQLTLHIVVPKSLILKKNRAVQIPQLRLCYPRCSAAFRNRSCCSGVQSLDWFKPKVSESSERSVVFVLLSCSTS
jgi:hypothetical protein